jgi:hypothetical protein
MFSSKKSRVLFFSGLIGCVLLFSNLSNVRGHSPSSMSLTYNIENAQLTVSISHSVSNNLTHYVESIVIAKNDVEVIDETYYSQPTTLTFSYTYNISAVLGDELSVLATCVQGGSNSKSLVVTDGGASDDDEKSSGISGYGIVLILGVSILTIGGLILRKHRKVTY